MQTDPIADLICSGRTISETAEALGESALAVYLHCERLGLVAVARAVYAGRDSGIAAMARAKRGAPWRRKPHGDRNAEIVAAVAAGGRCEDVAVSFGLSDRRVREIVRIHRQGNLFVDNSDSP
jgi:hypothetical protein